MRTSEVHFQQLLMEIALTVLGVIFLCSKGYCINDVVTVGLLGHLK